MLDAFGEGVAGALEFVLRGFELRQLLQLLGLFGGQGFAAAEVFQRFLRVQYLLVQGLGLRLGGGAVGGHGLLGLELLQLFFQALFLVTQGSTVGQGLQRRWVDVRQVDGQARGFEAFALEAVEYRFQRFYPQVAVVQFDTAVTQRQAEQRAIEQAHQAVDVLLGELFAQAGVAVVVGVVELLLDLLQALFQVADAFVQVFGAELPRLGQGAGQFVVGVLGRQQLLLQHLDVIDQGEAVLEHRQLAQPALDTGDFTLQAHQLLSTAALVVLQAVLLATVVLGLDHQLFLARHGVFLPGAQQGVEHWRNAVQFAAQDVALGHTTGQGLDQRAGGDQGVVVLLHAAHVAEGFLARGDIVDAARAQAVLEGVEEQLLELGGGDFAHVQQVDEQRAEGFQALLAGRAQRDHGQVQRHRGVATDQQTTQFVRLQLVGLDPQALEVGEQLFLAQAGVVLLVVGQVQFALVGKELVAETAARAAADNADDVRAVGQAQFAENVRGVAGEVEAARLLEAVLAEAHVRHARQDRELQGVDRGGLAQVVGAVDRQRVLQREQAQAVAGGVEQCEAADAVAFLAHASISCCSSRIARARASSSLSSPSKGLRSSGSSVRLSSSGLSSSTSTGVGSGRSLCRVAARSRSCCTARHTSRKRCIGGRKR
ncbi:hypothetical protein D3C78_780900 [compost metagenome]